MNEQKYLGKSMREAGMPKNDTYYVLWKKYIASLMAVYYSFQNHRTYLFYKSVIRI